MISGEVEVMRTVEVEKRSNEGGETLKYLSRRNAGEVDVFGKSFRDKWVTASNAIYSFSREKRDIPILRIGPGGVVGIENALDI